MNNSLYVLSTAGNVAIWLASTYLKSCEMAFGLITNPLLRILNPNEQDQPIPTFESFRILCGLIFLNAIITVSAASVSLQFTACTALIYYNYNTVMGNQESYELNSLANGSIPANSFLGRLRDVSICGPSLPVATVGALFLMNSVGGLLPALILMCANRKYANWKNENVVEEAKGRSKNIRAQFDNCTVLNEVTKVRYINGTKIDTNVYNLLIEKIIPSIAEFTVRQTASDFEKTTQRFELYAASAMFFKKMLNDKSINISPKLASDIMLSVSRNDDYAVQAQVKLEVQEAKIVAVTDYIFREPVFNKPAFVNIVYNNNPLLNTRKAGTFVERLAESFANRVYSRSTQG